MSNTHHHGTSRPAYGGTPVVLESATLEPMRTPTATPASALTATPTATPTVASTAASAATRSATLSHEDESQRSWRVLLSALLSALAVGAVVLGHSAAAQRAGTVAQCDAAVALLLFG